MTKQVKWTAYAYGPPHRVRRLVARADGASEDAAIASAVRRFFEKHGTTPIEVKSVRWSHRARDLP